MPKTGIYFKCFRGANAHLAVAEPDSLAVEDDLGRSWICYPVPRKVVERFDVLSDNGELDLLDVLAGGRTEVLLVFCQGPTKLAAMLGNRSNEG
jgi:hypothetical protein